MPRRRPGAGHLALAALTSAALLSGCAGVDRPAPTDRDVTTPAPSTATVTVTGTPSPSPGDGTSTTTPTPTEDAFGGRHVVAISIDGLNVDALRDLGRSKAFHIWALIDAGAATLDARAAYERTVTLPNHTGMVTGRPIELVNDGHGVTWNEDLPGRTVQQAAGHPVESVFDVVHEAGGTTSVFAGKSKFGLFERSWPDAVDTTVIADSLAELTDDVTEDLATAQRTFTFVHVAEPDSVGHHSGWMTPAYLRAVRRTDTAVGRIVSTIQSTPELDDTVVVLTGDHGGVGDQHSDATLPGDYTVLFVLAGDGVTPGDLYELSPGLQDPGAGRPSYDGPQPARNCDLANVSLRALGLRPVADSGCNGYRTMPVRRP